MLHEEFLALLGMDRGDRYEFVVDPGRIVLW